MIFSSSLEAGKGKRKRNGGWFSLSFLLLSDMRGNLLMFDVKFGELC